MVVNTLLAVCQGALLQIVTFLFVDYSLDFREIIALILCTILYYRIARKFWRELNLADWPQSAKTKNIGGF